MRILTSEVFDYIKKLEQAVADLSGGQTTLDGGAVTFGANDSGGAGFCQVLVPNLVMPAL